MLYILAGGEHIDMERTMRFSERLDKIYANPFEKKAQKPMSAAEIKEYMLEKVRKLRKKLED